MKLATGIGIRSVVVPAQRPNIIALVDREAARCAGPWIIGSRFTEYKGGQFVQGQFAEWELQPLDEEMRLELAKHLLPVISQLLQRPSPPDAEAFITVLDNDTRLAEWGTNPLLFSLAAIIYTQAGMLPSCRAALYHDIVEIMLSGRISDQQARAELRVMLADLSLQLYQTRGRNFTIPELFELFATRLVNRVKVGSYTLSVKLACPCQIDRSFYIKIMV